MNINSIISSGKLSNMQMELLKIFSHDLPEEQLVEIKALLSNYFATKAMDEFDRLEKEKNWTNETYVQWGKEHWRTNIGK